MTAGPLGEAHILIVPDVRQFAGRLKAELRAAMAAAGDPKINVGADTKGFGEQVKRKVTETERTTKTKVPVAPDLSRFAPEVRAYIARFDPKEQIKLAATLDRASFAKAAAEAKLLARRANPEMFVKLNTRNARNEFQLLDSKGRSALRGLSHEVFNSNIRLREMANILGGATLPILVSLASVGVAAFGSLTSAIVAASAAAAALPGLLAAAVQAVGVGALAFAGLGGALKAMSQEQSKAGVSALSTAKHENSAAEQIKAAQRGVRDALAGVRDAQLGLNDARREARQRLVDLRLEETRLTLDQRGAVLSIKEAEADLRQVQADPNATNLERQRAQLRLEEARQARVEIVRRIALNRQEIRSGVEGSDAVVAAKDRQAGAAQSLRDAQEALAKASRSAALATAAMPAPVNKLAQAMSNLSPAAQRFARFLFSLKPRLDDLRATAGRGLFPGLEAAIRNLVGGLFPTFRRIVDETARAMGGLAREGGRLLASGPFRRDFAQLGRDNVQVIRDAGHVSFNLFDALRNVVAAARPLTLGISKMVLGWSEYAKNAAGAGRESGRLARFFQAAGGALHDLLAVAGNVAGTIGAVLAAAFPSGAGLLGSLADATGKMRELATSVQGQSALREFFDRARPAIETIAGLLVILARKLFEIIVHVKNATQAVAGFLEKNPQLKDMAGTVLALAFAFKAFNVAGLAKAVGSLGKFVILNPELALVAGAILAIGGAFFYAYTHSQPFHDSVDQLGRTIRGAVMPALRSFGGFITDKVLPALQRAAPFIRNQLVGGLDFLAQALHDNHDQLKLFGLVLLTIGKFIAVTVIPAIAKLVAVHLRAFISGFGLAVGAVGLLGRVFEAFLRTVLFVFGSILDGAADAFGWMPGIGGKLKTARDHFHEFAAGVNAALDKIHDRDITVKARASIEVNKSVASFLKASNVPGFHAKGARIPGYGGGDIYPAMLEPGETVVPKELTPSIAGWARRQGIPGFRNGGLVGDAGDARGVKVTSFGSISPLEQGVARFDRALGALADTLGRRLSDVLGSFGATGRVGKVLDFLKAQLGEPYLWGGTGPDRWDCSGLMLRAFAKAGVELPRVAANQAHAGRAVSRAQAKLGDLIYFGNPAHHIGFYLGGDTMLHAPHTGDVVKVSRNRVGTGYRRVLDKGGFLMPGINVVENRTGRPELVPGPGRDRVGRAVSAGFGQGLHVENLIVQPISGRFRLSDVMTELRLQGVH